MEINDPIEKMSTRIEWLTKLHTNYIEAKQLAEYTNDPENEPYTSKYKALEILRDMIDELDAIDTDEKNICLIKIVLRHQLGVIAIETEESSVGQIHLEIGRKLIDDHFNGDDSVLLLNLNILNQLGYLWATRADYPNACKFLKEAEDKYNQWKNGSTNKIIPLSFDDVFYYGDVRKQESDDILSEVEKCYTQTLYFLAQVFEKLGENSKSALYCNKTLKRQYNQCKGKWPHDLIYDWSQNAATLSQYFANKGEFSTASHHLAAARLLLDEHKESFEDSNERYNKCKADIERICVKYILLLLEASKNRLEKNIQTYENTNNPNELMLIDDPKVLEFQNMISSTWANSFDEARELFLNGQKCLASAKEYYTLNEHASDYIDCVQDHSKLFRLTSYFEKDSERCAKMHKRRIDILDVVLKDINPKYFMNHCRQIMFEMGEIYSELVEIKLKGLTNKKGKDYLLAIIKINSLINKGVESFENFVATFKNKDNKLPTKFDDDVVKPILIAYFSIGRLATKYKSNDPNDDNKNWTKCETYYKKIKSYICLNPEHRSFVEEELALIEEMLTLIHSVRQEIY